MKLIKCEMCGWLVEEVWMAKEGTVALCEICIEIDEEGFT